MVGRPEELGQRLTTRTPLGQMLGQKTKADEIWIQHQ
jgi:hypothetical protein